MSEIIQTLRKKNDTSVEVYPNIKSDNIPAGAIITDKISNTAVTTEKIYDGAVTSDKLDTASVTTAKLDTGAVTTTCLADLSVTTAKLNDSAVTTAKINNDAVTSVKLADNSVITDKIADGNITIDKLDNSLKNAVLSASVKKHKIVVTLVDVNSATSTFDISVITHTAVAPQDFDDLAFLLKDNHMEYEFFLRPANDTHAYISDIDTGAGEITIYEDRLGNGNMSDYIYKSVQGDIIDYIYDL